MSYTASLFSVAPPARPAAALSRLPSSLLARTDDERQFAEEAARKAARESGSILPEAQGQRADSASFSGALAARLASGALSPGNGRTGAAFAADPDQERAYTAMGRAAARGQSPRTAPANEEALPGAALATAGQGQPQANAAGSAGAAPLLAPGESAAATAKSDSFPTAGGSGREQERGEAQGKTKAGTGTLGPDEGRSAERTFLGGPAAAPEKGGGQNAGKAGSGAGKDEEDEEAAGGNPQQLTEEEEAQVEDMKKRDREVRTHEQAHVAAGGGLVRGGARYQTETGPDGKAYAVGGEVQIDTSEAGTPEATMAKARRIKAAALAPAEPSSQDRAVAAQASQMETAARTEKREQTQETADGREGASEEATGAAADGAASGAGAGQGVEPNAGQSAEPGVKSNIGPHAGPDAAQRGARKTAPFAVPEAEAPRGRSSDAAPETEAPRIRSTGNSRLASAAAAYERASGARPPAPRGFTRDFAV